MNGQRTDNTTRKKEYDNVSLYEVLELEKIASHDDIKQAYYKLAIKNHPDNNPNNEEARKKFNDVNEAYKILSDHQQRSIYDIFGRFGLLVINKYGLKYSSSKWFKCWIVGLILGIALTSLCCCCCCCCNCCCSCCGMCQCGSDDKEEETQVDDKIKPISLKELEEMQKTDAETIDIQNVTSNDGIEYIDANVPTILTCKLTKTDEIKAST